MSDKEQMMVAMRLAGDGTVIAHVHERIALNLQAKLALSIACSLASAMTVRDAIIDEDRKVSPKTIASVACDISQQLMNQFSERGWSVELPDPIPTERELQIVTERLRWAEVK